VKLADSIERSISAIANIRDGLTKSHFYEKYKPARILCNKILIGFKYGYGTSAYTKSVNQHGNVSKDGAIGHFIALRDALFQFDLMEVKIKEGRERIDAIYKDAMQGRPS
jgi:hypothetical protein